MKNTKRIVSFLLSAIMVITTFLAVGPVFTIEAEAAITLGDSNLSITQTRVVGPDGSYAKTYQDYQARFFGGDTDDNWPTNFVIPGLSSSDDYTPQGMTYWAEKEWILISAYDASGTGRNSVIYALDAVSTEFVALFKIFNSDGSNNTSHGGGIAASEHNFYYADKGSDISYWPLAEMNVAKGTVKEIKIYDTIDCSGELFGGEQTDKNGNVTAITDSAATSYCCYDEGVLWTGNFYFEKDSDKNPSYGNSANSKYNSMLIGYKLVGSNSADEWAYLKGRYNKPITINTPSGTTNPSNGATMTWKAMETSGFVTISGSITAPTADVGEFCPTFGSFALEEGKDYTIEFISTNRSSDLYMFAPNGKHCNVKQAQSSTITELDNGTFHYKMNFTAGLKPTGADSSWPTTQSTDGTYTGTYTIRFDQDAIQAGEAREFIMSNIRISETPISALKNKATTGNFQGGSSGALSGAYTIAHNDNNGTMSISGTVTNNTSATVANTYTNSDHMVAPLIEGETYTLEFVAASRNYGSYVWSPANTFRTLFYGKQVTDLGNGKYKHSVTFTAGQNPDGVATGGENNWPVVQNLDGSYTGFYKFRFDLNSIPVGSTEFEITDIKLRKTDESRLDLISPHAGAAGDPTYCIAFNDDIDRVQYAMVDKGRIYISRSWSRTESTNHIRELAIGNININAPGTEPLTINGSTRLCHVVNPEDVTKFGGNKDNENRTQMLYMGEALCVIDDYLYMFGESAAWAYNGKASSVCPEPIDVIWKIDQYKIMGLTRPTEDLEASHYVKVDSMAEIVDGEEYIIAYESALKDPVTQKNILYAIDAFGGYGENKLPKADVDGENTFTKASTGDSMGIVCYPITTYSTEAVEDEDGNTETHLHLEKEDDANKSIRWQISGANSGNLRLKNMDFYYNAYPYLYFDGRLFGMAEEGTKDNLLSYIKLLEAGNSKFYIHYDYAYYLWCVDGSNERYQNLYTKYYFNHGETGYVPSYSGLEEQAGTVHSDGLYKASDTTNGSGCLMGTGGVGENIHYGMFNIYKRVPDPHSSVYDTRVFTDLNAELQPDGTYNLTLQAYTTNKVQYQKVDPRPTDFIFVLDASGSMKTQDCNGYHRHNSFQLEAAAGTQDAAGNSTSTLDDKKEIGTYTGNMWVQHSDGEMCQVSVRTVGDGRGSWNVSAAGYNRYLKAYLWYTHPDGTKYWYHPNSGTWTTTETSYDEAQRIGGASKKDRYQTDVFYGVCYEKRSDSSRLSNMQIAVNQLIWKIQKKAQDDNLDHRVALVQFGSTDDESYLNTGMYANTGTTAMYQYDRSNQAVTADVYKNAFFTTDEFSTARTIVENISVTDGDPDTFSSWGLDMATNTVIYSQEDGQKVSYLAGGDRSACIIMITDGVPGYGGDNSTSANLVANDAIGITAQAKKYGAYVYTVQMGNNTIEDFDMDKYMDYVSSEFIEATSMDDPGERNISEIEYRMDVPTGTAFSLDSFVDNMFNSVTSNSTNALATLDANSVIREVLNTDAFIYTDKTERKVGTARAAYDGLGRLYFEDMVEGDGVTYEIDEENDIFTVTGFDYSSRYVSPSNLGDGKAAAVVIEVTNVLPNPEKVMSGLDETDMSSVPVSVDEFTGVYQNEENMSEEINFKQKGFPVERIQIPEYTYVLDYGTEMLDIDVNGILKSVSPELTAQRDANGNISYNNKLKSDNANVGIEIASNSLDLIYSIKPTTNGQIDNSKGYVLIQRLDGTYDWFRINVVPASNVYYEETEITRTASSNPDWVATGTAEFTGQDITSTEDIYGNDSRYVNSTNSYSRGTYYKATVSDSAKRSDTATFTFTGTGFDLYSACGSTTGLQVVNVKKGGTTVKAYVVDTYHSDSTYSSMLTQVPIVRFSGEYADYTVESTAAYLPSLSGALKAQSIETQIIDENGTVSYTSELSDSTENEILRELGFEELIGKDVEFITFSEDSVLNGGEGPFAVEDGAFTTQAVTSLENYIDGIRVYNPLDSNYSNYIPSEQNVQYFNVIESLASSDGMVEGSANTGVAYIQGSLAEGFTFADYNKSEIGAPKHELYLKGDSNVTNALSFTVKGWSSNKRVMISARVASGESVTMQVNSKVTSDPIKNKAEVYYDITPYAVVNGDEATFAICNQSPGTLLAINNIKVTDSTSAVQPITFGSLSVVEDIFSLPVTEVDINAPVYTVPDDGVKFPEVSPSIPDENPEPGDDIVPPSDDNNSEEPAEDGFFAKVESFFVKIFNFFKNIFNKVFSFFEF